MGSVKQGYNSASLGREAFRQMWGQENDVERYRDALASDEYNFKTDKWWQKLASGSAGQLGQWVRQLGDPTTATMASGAAGAAAIAGQLGPQALAPEEIVTVPGAFAAGLKAGSTKTGIEIEAGLAYLEMLDKGVSEETARAIATGVGLLNGALDFVQLDELLKAYRVLDKSGADSALLDRVMRELKDRGIDTVSEAGLETVQESVTMGGVQLGSRLDTGQDAYSFKEMVDRLLGTATNALATYTLTSLPASVHNIGTARSRLAAEGEARLLAGEMPTEEQLWAYRNKHVAPAAGVCDPPQRGIQRAEHPPAGL